VVAVPEYAVDSVVASDEAEAPLLCLMWIGAEGRVLGVETEARAHSPDLLMVYSQVDCFVT
jgi:hypothetical protein